MKENGSYLVGMDFCNEGTYAADAGVGAMQGGFAASNVTLKFPTARNTNAQRKPDRGPHPVAAAPAAERKSAEAASETGTARAQRQSLTSTAGKAPPQPFFLGMDIGSFKTAVVTSNGERHTFHSAVGWPRDHVARTALDREVVLGEEVLRWRLALDAIRPFAKGAMKHVDADGATSNEAAAKRRSAAKLLIEHAVSLVNPPAGMPLFAVIGAPSRVRPEYMSFLREASSELLDAVLIVAEPFTVAFGVNRLVDALIVDIGAGTIDICPVYGTYPKEEDQVTIPIGGDSVDEAFCNLLRKTDPKVRLSLNMAREIKERHGFVHDLNESVVVSLPIEGAPTQVDVSGPLQQACKTLVEPILDGVRSVVSRFDPEFQRPMLDNIVLAGGGSQLLGLDRQLERALGPLGGGTVRRVHDSVFAGAAGALKLATNMPLSNWQRLQEAWSGGGKPPKPLRKAA
jgi:rod shape-determining protein MreB